MIKVSIDAPSPVDLWDDVQNGVVSRFPRRYWENFIGQQRAELICRAFLQRRGMKSAAEAAQLTQSDFEGVRLRGMLAQVYDESPYRALKAIFPELQPWQMERAPRELWVGPDACAIALRALRWALSEGACRGQALSLACLSTAGLRGMLKYVFGDQVRLALHALATGECPPARR